MAVALDRRSEYFKEPEPESAPNEEKTPEQVAFAQAHAKTMELENQIRQLLLESSAPTLSLEERRTKLNEINPIKIELNAAYEEAKARLDDWLKAITDRFQS